MNQHPIKFFERYEILPRAQQKHVVDQIAENWNKYKYFALSLPTGVGKTYISTAIADSIDKAYILTSTLQLQDQYMKSWSELINLKGRGNYTCNLNQNFTVDAAPCSVCPDLLKQCMVQGMCAYYNQKKAAIASKAMITNPVYMLYSTHCGFAKEDETWVKRDALIIDEAHNVENHLVQFAESDIDPELYHNDFGVKTQNIVFCERPEENYFKIVEIYEILQRKAQELAEKMQSEFPQNSLVGTDARKWARGFNDKVAEKVRKLNSKIYQLDKAIQPLKIFFNTHSTPEELISRWIVSKSPDKNSLKIAPIYGDFLFKEYFGKLSDKFIFLSATLGSKSEFCKELGIKESECLYIETDSPFDPMKSPIISMPSIKLSKDHYDQNVKKIGGIIDDILDIHKGQRGIIHSVTYDIQKHIFMGVSTKNQKRLLCRDMDVLLTAHSGKNSYAKKYKNDELLEKHEKYGKLNGSVLLSPSMMEGVDLHDDLADFQIIIKLPWANLGDVRVNKKSKIDPDWYKNRMWLNILQASGRSTRHEEDTSVTYILDSNFDYFLKEWQINLPKWFLDRLVR
jgi:Rad3-related DNA helicase